MQEPLILTDETNKLGKHSFKQGDSFELIKQIKDESITMTITSPPYNVGKSYEKKVALEKYLEPYYDFAKELYRTTKTGGSLCWEVGNFINKGEVVPLDILYYDIFTKAGFKLRNRIIWHFGHGLHASKRFSGRYETILWFTKGDEYTFNLDAVRVPSKYPGKLNYKGANKGKPSGNPLGKNPSDIWEVVQRDWENEIWDIVNVKSNHPEKTIHPCQFPVELVERCVLALTNEGDLVFDPFMGVGSACIGSVMHGRDFLGYDYDKEFVDLAQLRLDKFVAGELKLRPMTKPKYQPTGKEKVSQVPMEWLQK